MEQTQNRRTSLDSKNLLTVLWIYLSLNYIYCDHLGIMEPEAFKGLLAGHIGTMAVSQEFLLAAALLLQIPFGMVVLSLMLQGKARRMAHIVAATIMLLVQLGTMGMGTAPGTVYLFYSVLEIICCLIIIGLAWKQAEK